MNNMEKIKLQILEHLSHNCRMPIAELAKSLRQPRHIVAYHRSQLLKEKIIINHELILNYEALGYKEFIVFLKFFHYHSIREKITKYIINHPHVRWASETFPNFQLRVVFAAKDLIEFEKILDELESVAEGKLMQKEVIITQDFLKKESYTTKEKKEIKRTQIDNLNEQEKKLLQALFENPTDSLLSLSKKSQLSMEAIRQKIRKFQESGLIMGFSAKHDAIKVGYNFWCVLLLRINNLDKHLAAMKTILYSDPCYGRTRRTFGTWNIEMSLYTPTYLDLQHHIALLEQLLGDDFESSEIQIYTTRLMNTRIPPAVLSTSLTSAKQNTQTKLR